MTVKELKEQLNYAHDSDDVYVMVTIEKEKSMANRLYTDFLTAHEKIHITKVTHDQFHCTLHVPRIVV